MITRQIYYDFEPYWNLRARLLLSTSTEAARHPEGALAGDAPIYLREWRDRPHLYRDSPYCFGFHDIEPSIQKPVGYVFVDDGDGNLRPDWSVSLSHEILELIANPHVNLRVRGPRPSFAPKSGEEGVRTNFVYYHREVCDPVQEPYTIDGLQVSNFVLPLYFFENGHLRERVDFLGPRTKMPKPLESFGVNPGGYVPYFDPASGLDVKLAVNQRGDYSLLASIPLAAEHGVNSKPLRFAAAAKPKGCAPIMSDKKV